MEVPNLGTGKKSKLFPKTRSLLDEFREPLPGCSFNPSEDDLSDEETQMDEDIEGMQFENSNNGSDEEEDERCASLPRERI